MRDSCIVFTRLSPVVALLTFVAMPPLAGAASITGTVVYEGAVPNFPPIQTDADPHCANLRDEPLYPETLVLGDDQKIANVFVHITDGLPEDAEFPVPEEPVVLTQEGCRYSPRVFGVMAGQDLTVLNPDGILHNVNARSRVNRGFNLAMTSNIGEITVQFDEPEFMFEFRCDVHPWMIAHCAVMDHPFFTVTGEDGRFVIEGLAPGTYEIEAWHERLPAETATVTLEEGETAELSFTMRIPGR